MTTSLLHIGTRSILSAILAALLTPLVWPAGHASAQPQPKAPGIESDEYRWDAAQPEVERVLSLTGNAVRGSEVYARCVSCHLPSGAGQSQREYPQLAGQHTSVLVKQIVDIREGRRDNPIMYPFVVSLTDDQQVADLALYVSLLKIPRGNEQGQGVALERGEELYTRDCARCHGVRGQGSALRLYPVLAGQHYGYMLGQISAVAEGRRRNAHPEMAEIVVTYRGDDMQAVADYISRLEWPERLARE